MSADTNTAEAQAHVADTKQRRRRAWRMFGLVVLAVVCLLLILPFVGYLIWQARGRALLQAEIDAIVAKGEPLTTAEMTAWHRVPEGERDITKIWMAAVEPLSDLNSNDRYSRYANVPIVGTAPIPPLEEPWSDPQVVADYLAEHRQELANLHAAARESGSVRYPCNFLLGFSIDAVQFNGIRNATGALTLELHQNLRNRDATAASQSIDTQLALTRTMDHEPYFIFLLSRISGQSGFLDGIRGLAKTLPLTDEQLAQLQQKVRSLRGIEQLPDVLISERAFVYHEFHRHPSELDEENLEPPQELEATHDISRIYRPEDCAVSLAMFAELIAASQQPLPQVIDTTRQVATQYQTMYGDGALGRYRYQQSLQLFPMASSACDAIARFVARRDLTDTFLALKRFKLKHGQLPAALGELVPDFLPQLPVDPFDGKPIRYLAGESALIYSIGTNLVDDGGVTDPSGAETDIVVKFNLPQASK